MKRFMRRLEKQISSRYISLQFNKIIKCMVEKNQYHTLFYEKFCFEDSFEN